MKVAVLAVLALGVSSFAEMKAPPITGTIVAVRERDMLMEARPQAPGEPAQSAGKTCHLYIKGENGMLYHAQLMKSCDDPAATNWTEGKAVMITTEKKNKLVLRAPGQITSLDLLEVKKAGKASLPPDGDMRVLTTAPPKKKQ